MRVLGYVRVRRNEQATSGLGRRRCGARSATTASAAVGRSLDAMATDKTKTGDSHLWRY
jgi:hypothetical protein